MSDGTWDQFEDVLRQIVGLKNAGESGVALETLIEEAWDLWPQVPPPAEGTERAWPPELLATARELGFERSTATDEVEPLSVDELIAEPVPAPPAPRTPSGRATPPPMPRIDPEMMKLAKDIEVAIADAGGVGNVRVNCSRTRVALSGIAADDDARDEAQIIAAKLAPGVEIDNSITVA